MSLHSFLQGQRCPAERYTRRNNRKYSLETVKTKIKDLVNDEYEISEYKSVSEKALFLHKKCGNAFYMTVNHFFSGNRCPKCSHMTGARLKNKNFNISYYQKLLDLKEPKKFTIIDNFNNSMDTRTRIRCNTYNQIFTSSINNLLHRMSCPICRKNKRINEFNKRMSNINFLILDSVETILSKKRGKINLECLSCHKKFSADYHNFYEKCGNINCPNCNTHLNEEKISNILDSMNIKYEREKTFEHCKNKKALKFDFYISNLNLAIEYDGEFHYIPIFGKESLEQQQKRDKIKTEFCIKEKINLLRIPYSEKDKIEDILKLIFLQPTSYDKNYNLNIRNMLN